MRRQQSWVAVVAALVLLLGLVRELVLGHEIRAAYPDDRAIDPGLARAEAGFVSSMSHGDEGTVVFDYADRGRVAEMTRFYFGYGGRPTRTAGSGPEDDGLGDQTLAVTCGQGDVRSLDVVWEWSNGGWRASPAYQLLPHDRLREYPGC